MDGRSRKVKFDTSDELPLPSEQDGRANTLPPPPSLLVSLLKGHPINLSPPPSCPDSSMDHVVRVLLRKSIDK